jgi:hypothetical protein
MEGVGLPHPSSEQLKIQNLTIGQHLNGQSVFSLVVSLWDNNRVIWGKVFRRTTNFTISEDIMITNTSRINIDMTQHSQDPLQPIFEQYFLVEATIGGEIVETKVPFRTLQELRYNMNQYFAKDDVVSS